MSWPWIVVAVSVPVIAFLLGMFLGWLLER